MINVSQAFVDLMKSNFRPKVEPIISINGIDENGNEVKLTWNASDIQNLTYKRSIDPAGRELPFMELTWTERYIGKFNKQNYPEKYNNIAKYMKVELSFAQKMSFTGTWKSLFENGVTWKQLFEDGVTWKSITKYAPTETVKMPTLFLSAKPTVEGQTIKWVARDLLFFLNESYILPNLSETSYQLAIQHILLESRSAFLKSPDIVKSIMETVDNVPVFQTSGENSANVFLMPTENATKNILLKFASTNSYYMDFLDEYIVFKKAKIGSQTDFEFSDSLLYQYPKITLNGNISAYKFKNTQAIFDEDQAYLKPYDELVDVGNGYYKSTWNFEDYGNAIDYGNLTSTFTFMQNSKKIIGLVKKTDYSGGQLQIQVEPMVKKEFENIYETGLMGEIYEENNEYNTHAKGTPASIERLNFLKTYFSEENSTLEINSLPILHTQTGDIVKVPTNLYENDEMVKKDAIIVSFEMTYNGALKEKIIAHEVQL